MHAMMSHVFRVLALILISATLTTANATAADRPDLVVAVNDQPAKLEPADAPLAVDMRVTYSIFDTLIRRDYLAEMANPEGGAILAPGLAAEWTRLDDRTIELRLRDDVVFHNGDPLTADDVAFTFSEQRVFGEDPFIPTARRYFGDVEEVVVVDPLTVRIRAAAPDPVLELRLAVPAAGIVNRRAYLENGTDAFKRAPVGTGPMRFVEWQDGDYLRFEAFDDYWGGAPTFETITFRVVPEMSARVAGLINGEFDIALQISPDQFPTLESRDGVEVRGSVIDNYQMIWLIGTDPVVSDRLIRQAMSLAIDRQLLIDSLWHGLTTIPLSYQLPAFGPLYDPTREGFVYDPDRARALIEEAGYDGEPIIIRNVTGYYPNGDEMIQAVQRMWQDVGLNVELEMVEGWPQVYEPGRSVGTGSATYLMPAPEGIEYMFFGEESITQARHGFVSAGELNRLAAEISSTMDVDRRRDLYQQALDILMEEMPGTPVYMMPQFFGVNVDVAWHPYPDYIMDFRPENLSFQSR